MWSHVLKCRIRILFLPEISFVKEEFGPTQRSTSNDKQQNIQARTGYR